MRSRGVNRHEPAPSVDQLMVDFFRAISVTIDQIDDDIRNDVPVRLRALVLAHRARDADRLRDAAELLATHIAGIQSVASAVARACNTHLKEQETAK
jgi:hypothetical protein